MQVQLAPGYEPHPEQLKLHRSNARFICLACGTRGGKTISAVAEFLFRIYRDYHAGKGRKPAGIGRNRSPRLRYWLVAPTHSLVREAVYYLLQLVPPELVERRYEDSIWVRPDIRIEFKSADNPHSLQGAGVDGMLIDEAARVKAEAWMGGLSARLTANKGWCIFSSTPTGQNWFYNDIFRLGLEGDEKKREDHFSLRWATTDNPYVDKAEIELKRQTLPPRYFKRDFEADFEAFHGSVFDEFSDTTHVLTENEFRLEYNAKDDGQLRRLFRRVVAGVDWGWTNPGAIVVVGFLGEGRYVVLDEAYRSNRQVVNPETGGDSWVKTALDLRQKWGIADFWCDPSRPSDLQVFLNHGLNAWPSNNDVAYGLRKINEVLHAYQSRPRLRILGHCKNLIREMKSYVWAEKKGTIDDLREQPAPNQQDHAIDALRYAVVALTQHETEGQIGTVSPGRRDETRRGPFGR